MVDWKWFGWTLAGAAFCASTAMYALRTFLHTTDVRAAQGAAVVFGLVLTGLFVARVRFNAWKRAYLLSEDFARSNR